MTDPLGLALLGRLLASLGLIVGGLLAARWWFGRGRAGTPCPPRVLGRAGIARGAAVVVVEVDDRRFLLGAGEHGVSLLSELDAEREPQAPVPRGMVPARLPVPAGTGLLERLRALTVRAPVERSQDGARSQGGARRLVTIAAVAFVLLLVGGAARAQEPAPQPPPPAAPAVPDVPDVGITIEGEDGALSRSVVLVLLLTLGSVAPGLLLLMTTFTRFVIVLGLAKNALALQTIPPSQVLVGLALFLTFFVMNPVFSEINEDALQPLLREEIGQSEALAAGFAPLRGFMLAQTRPDDLELFVDLSGDGQPATPDDVPATTLIPAFVISELRTAFVTGFVIFVPFLVIDLVVAAVLMSLGMVMLPPIFVSLPLKLLLFVLVDGWVLIVGALVESVRAAGA
jgi:flagellar biosynthetic protein FliP